MNPALTFASSRPFGLSRFFALIGLFLVFVPALHAADNDFSGPAITITSHTNGQIVNTKTIVLSGTASDAGYGGNGVSQVYANGLVNGATATGTGTVQWSQTINLVPGANYPSVYAYDGSEARNWRDAPITINFQPVDAVPPAIVITSHENGQIVDTDTITVGGTASDAGHGDNGISSVYLRGTLPDVRATGAGTATWSRTVKLYPGTNYVTVWAYDDSDVQNTRDATITIHFQPRDAQGPQLHVTSHTHGQTVHARSITLEGTASDAGRGDNGISSVYVRGWLTGVQTTGAETSSWRQVLELQPGPNNVTIYAYDDSDVKNESNIDFLINYQPDDTVSPELAVTSHEDGATVFESKVTLRGTASDAGRGDNGISYVYLQGRLPDSSADGAGTVQWSREVELSPGRNTLTLYAYDNSEFPNEVSRTFVLNFQPADTLGPSVTVASHADGQTVTSSLVTLSGAATDAGRGDNGVSAVYLAGKIDGASTGGSALLNWSRQVTLRPGPNTLEIRGYDAAPFPNETLYTMVLHYQPVDVEPPNLQVTSHQDGQIVHNNVLTLAGIASDANRGDNGISGVWVNFKRVDNDTAAGAATVSWTRTLPLQPGTNTIYVSAADDSEVPQETRISLTIIYEAEDELAPSITVTSPNNNQTFTAPAITVSGSASDAMRGDNGVAEVRVNGMPATGGTATGAGVAGWSQTIQLVPGTNVISIVAIDDSQKRNSSAVTLTAIYDPEDTSPPIVSISSHTPNQRVTSNQVTISGVASDAGRGNHGITSVTVNGTEAAGGTATGEATAAWTQSVNLNPGNNVISVVAKDGSARQNASAISITLIHDPVDLTAPGIQIASHGNGQVVASPELLLSGTASDAGFGDSGILDVNVNSLPATLTIAGGGAGAVNWTSSLTLVPGSNVISIVARDGSPNKNSAARTITLVYEAVDRTPPGIVVTSHQNEQAVSSASVILTGTASDAGRGDGGISSVTINGTAAQGGSAEGAGTATWHLALNLSPGKNVISIIARDTLGNSGSKTLILNHDPRGVPAPGDFDWARNAGGSGTDAAYAVAADRDGNCYVTGLFEGTATFGSVSLSSTGASDIFLAKYDSEGGLVWARQAGGTGADAGLGVDVDGQGNCYVTGYFSGSAVFSGMDLATSGAFDLFLAKYDPDGVLLWIVNTGTSTGIYGSSVRVDRHGNSHVAGSFYGQAFLADDTLATTANLYDAFVARIGSEGDFQWARQFGGDASDQATGISVGEDGHCAVTGYFEGEARFGLEGEALISAGDRDLFVCRLDSEGAVEWVCGAGGVGITMGSAIATDRYGQCLVTGYYDGTAVFGDTTFVNAGYYDLFVAKYTAAGQLLWAKAAGTAFGINGNAIATDGRGHAYVVGSFIGPVELGSTGFENGALGDIFVAKFDGDGNVAWAKHAGGEGESTGYGVAVQPDGTCYVAGAMSGQANFGTTTLVSGDLSDMVLAKLPADGSAFTAIEIGGAAGSADRIEVEGPAFLSGTLQVTFIGGFVPSPDEAFTVLTTTQGVSFSSLTVETINAPFAGEGFVASVIGDDLVLTWTKMGRNYDECAATQFTAAQLAEPSISGRLMDPDFDDVLNFFEFIYGFNALESNGGHPIDFELVPNPSGPGQVPRFEIAVDPSASGYRLEVDFVDLTQSPPVVSVLRAVRDTSTPSDIFALQGIDPVAGAGFYQIRAVERP